MRRSTTALAVTTATLLGIGGFGASCVDDEPASYSLRGDRSERDSETDARRRLMNVIVKVSGVDTEIDGTTFGAAMEAHCIAYLEDLAQAPDQTLPTNCHTGTPTSYTAPSNCGHHICSVHLQLCMANLAMELAGLASPVTLLNSPAYTVYPQTRATNAALHEGAMMLARDAMVDAGTELRHAAGETTAGICTASNLNTVWSGATQSFGESFSSSFIEAYQLIRESALAAAADNVAVADATFSHEPQLSKAARLAQVGEVLSRAHAAHILVGGDSGLTGFPDGIYTRPPPSPRAQVALQALRASGYDPAGLAGPNSMDSILVGMSDQTVAHRLAERWAASELIDDEIDADGFAALFGIEVADFTEAREIIVAENQAHGRSLTAELPPTVIPTDDGEPQVATEPTFAATATPPGLQPTERLTELARRTTSYTDDRDTPGSLPGDWETRPYAPTYAGGGSSYTNRGAAQAMDYAIAVAYNLVNNTTLPKTTRDFLGHLATGGMRDRPSRLETCYRYDGSSHRVRLRSYFDPMPTTGDVLVVQGRDGLVCATVGSIDGAPCDIDDYALSSPTVVSSGLPTNIGFVGYFEWNVVTASALPEYYVVRRRSGATDGMGGGYESLGSIHVTTFTTTSVWKYCTLTPGIPEFDKKAGDYLAASTSESDGASSAVSCSGLPKIGQIPLEDELTEDFNDVESSWRHYLDRARSAADRADALGQELIENGLSMDIRAEAAIEQLEAECGGAINADGLIPADLDVRTGGGSCPSCNAGYRCLHSVCVLDEEAALLRDAASSSDASRLAECLGSPQPIPWITLGSQDLCIWIRDGEPNSVCTGSGPERPCPYLKTEGVACAVPDFSEVTLPGGGSVPTQVAVTIDTHLGYFDNRESASRGGDRPLRCDLLRKLRNPDNLATQEDDFASIVRSNMLDPQYVREIARSIGFEARIGDFGSVTLHGSSWISIGDIVRGTASSSWPCTGTPVVTDCGTAEGDGDGLFCQINQCVNQTTWAAFRRRLERAVGAARILSGVGLRGVASTNVTSLSLPVSWSGDATTATSGTVRIGSLHDTGFDPPETRSVACLPGDTTTPAWTDPDGVPLYADDCDGEVFWTYPGGAYHGSNPLDSSSRVWADLSWRSTPSRGSRDRLHHLVKSTIALAQDGTHDNDVVFGPSTAGWADLTNNSRQLTARDVVDAAELICEAGNRGGSACDPNAPPAIGSTQDLDQVTNYMRCVASALEHQGELTIFANVPQRAVAALGETGGTGTYPATAGAFTEALGRLRRALLDLATVPGEVASTLRDVANDADRLRNAVARNEVARARADVALQSAFAGEGSAIFGQITNPFAALSAACSMAQIALAAQLTALTHTDLTLASEGEFIAFRDSMNIRLARLSRLAAQLSEAREHADAALAELDTQRRTASRALAVATFADSDPMGRHYAVSTVMRRRMNTSRIRYENARVDAIRAAHIAKIAIEQRVGVHLSEMTDPMTLVAAPSTWEATLCESTGVDYARIRDETGLVADNYADGFIGDYVTKLENFMESYSIDHPFQAGEDTSVISLRDEVRNSRAMCEVDVDNHLLFAGKLAVVSDPDTHRGGWEPDGCDLDEDGSMSNCAFAYELSDSSDAPFDAVFPELGQPDGYRVNFGSMLDEDTSTIDPDSALIQKVDLAPGLYRLSWYARAVDTFPIDPEDAVIAEVEADPGTSILGEVFPATAPMPAPAWYRYHGFFRLESDDVVRVAMRPSTESTTRQQVDIAAIMLEAVDDEIPAGTFNPEEPEDFPPKAWVATADTSTREMAVCEDTTGEVFRSTGWERRCLQLCSEGFGSACPPERSEPHCFWETSVTISQGDIDRGRLIHAGGFARGNFNYRFDSIGVNFVGTNTRRCDTSMLGSTCYSAGYIPYSIEHLGPYFVRNFRGDDSYRAPLFTGRIEHARGLAAERYLTNPLSTADRSLIEPYLRREFRGRPLDGTYMLRVWDEDGVDFNAIEDVQIVLNYRYWTRND